MKKALKLIFHFIMKFTSRKATKKTFYDFHIYTFLNEYKSKTFLQQQHIFYNDLRDTFSLLRKIYQQNKNMEKKRKSAVKVKQQQQRVSCQN